MLNLASVAPWLQNTGVYGPVTATLDWCEVKIRLFIDMPHNNIKKTDKLPILALYRGDGQRFFQCLYPRFGVVRWFSGNEGTSTLEIPLRLRCSYSSFFPLPHQINASIGRRSSRPRQFFLPCNSPLRSSTCR
jgi:hypothetical protein